MSNTKKLQAGDLRVGNLLKCNDLFIEVSGISKNSFTCTHKGLIYFNSEDCEPIELTPTILEECGFVKSDDHYGGYLSELFAGGRIRLVQIDTSSYKWHNGCWDTIISSLHQLQNLYHSLTGKELDYKPKN